MKEKNIFKTPSKKQRMWGSSGEPGRSVSECVHGGWDGGYVPTPQGSHVLWCQAFSRYGPCPCLAKADHSRAELCVPVTCLRC